MSINMASAMVLSGEKSEDLERRFFDKVRKEDGCWRWLASANSLGYGKIRIGGRRGKSFKAHRVSFFIKHGWEPEYVLHTCDNPGCVNPDHLYAGTVQDNVADMWSRGRAKAFFVDKLTEDQRLLIANQLRAGRLATKLGKEYGVHAGTINRIRKQYAVGWFPKPPIECSACGTPTKPAKRGMCGKCYMKWWRPRSRGCELLDGNRG
jgi:hypothetical protein